MVATRQEARSTSLRAHPAHHFRRPSRAPSRLHFDSARLQAHINVPADRFAARLAVTVADGDGFIRNSVDSRRFAEEDYVGARLSFRIQPGDATTIDIVAQQVEDDGAAGELWVPRKDYLLDPSDIRLTTVTLENPHLDTVNDIVSADVSFDIGATTLTSITGYAKGITRDLDDCAGTPQLVGCVRGYDPLSYEQLSQEIRLASSGNSIDWLAGLYFLDADAFADARGRLFRAGAELGQRLLEHRRRDRPRRLRTSDASRQRALERYRRASRQPRNGAHDLSGHQSG